MLTMHLEHWLADTMKHTLPPKQHSVCPVQLQLWCRSQRTPNRWHICLRTATPLAATPAVLYTPGRRPQPCCCSGVHRHVVGATGGDSAMAWHGVGKEGLQLAVAACRGSPVNLQSPRCCLSHNLRGSDEAVSVGACSNVEECTVPWQPPSPAIELQGLHCAVLLPMSCCWHRRRLLCCSERPLLALQRQPRRHGQASSPGTCPASP